jgi:LuxR family transcriptional regulator, quorum-sensing system regulator BjaR1
MGARAETFGPEAFDFIEGADRLSTPDAVIDNLYRVIAPLGFESLFFAEVRSRSDRDIDPHVFVAKCHLEFLPQYVARDYVHVDPSVARTLRSHYPFEWNTADFTGADKRLVEFRRLLDDCRLTRGLSVPIHGRSGLAAGVSMGGVGIELTARTKAALHLMSVYAFERILQLTARERAEPRLTLREREVLAWSAKGKSAWEIGEILSVAKRTVDEHAQSAMRKLGATTRTHAVAIALRNRLFEV